MKDKLHYDLDTGQFYWIMKTGNKRVGDIAGSITTYDKYRRIKLNGKMYLAHRLAWFFVYNAWPENEIDHINGVRDDNRIENLRDVPHWLNQRNAKRRSDNTSGVVGVKRISHKGAQYWTSTWTDNNGVDRNKWFNIRKLGENIAHQSAIQFRQNVIKELKGFTERHGS